MAQYCTATTKAGIPCSVPAMWGTDFCIGHNPSITTEQRQIWSKQGGDVKTKGIRRFRISEDVHEYIGLKREEILKLIALKLEKFEKRFGNMEGLTPRDELTIAIAFVNLVKAWAYVDGGETAAGEESAGWRMKGAV